MSTRGRSVAASEARWIWLAALLKSIRNRPIAWLLMIWLVGWALCAWHALHLASWETVWDTLYRAASLARAGHEGQASLSWLRELGRWGQIALYTSTGILALYVGPACWVWRRYTSDWMWTLREERVQG